MTDLDIHTLFFDLDRMAVPMQALSSDERVRVARKGTPQLRQRQAASFLAVRETLGRVLGLEASAVPIVVGQGGKPFIEGYPLHFNLSHCGGVALLAWGRRPLGVDIEARINRPSEALAMKVLAPAERARWAGVPETSRGPWLARAWVRKEAALKAMGLGLRRPPRTVDVGGGDGEGQPWHAMFDEHAWAGVDLVTDTPPGWFAALCLGPEPAV